MKSIDMEPNELLRKYVLDRALWHSWEKFDKSFNRIGRTMLYVSCYNRVYNLKQFAISGKHWEKK